MAGSRSLGFVGLGTMGHHMARHLLEAGNPVMIYDVRADAGEELLAKGATRAQSLVDVAQKNEVVFTCLPGPANVEAVAYGPEGILENLRPGSTFIDLTTNSPATVRKIYARGKELGVDVLDATMSGGAHGAASGRLTLMVGGDEEVLERQRSILEAMSDNVTYCGGSGTGAVTKIVNNMIALSVSVLVGEGLILGTKWGVDLERLVRIIGESTGATWRMNDSFPRYLLKGNFKPGFTIDLSVKDLQLAKDLASELGLDLGCLDLSLGQYIEAQQRGWGGQHSEAVVKLSEERTGTELRIAEK